MTNAVSRQYEIMKLSASQSVTSQKALAKFIENYNRNQIKESKPSAFQRNLFNETIAIKSTTIQKYVSLSVSLGVLGDNLKPKSPLDGTQSMNGFASTLQELLADFCEPKGFGIDQVKTIMEKRYSNKSPSDFPLSAPTLASLIEEIQPGVSDFIVAQCFDMFQLLYNDFQFTQTRMILHKNVFWSAS